MNSLFLISSFFFGSLFGSFANVLILRLPKEEDVVFLPSHCPSCKTKIKWYQNIPIFSFLFLKGRCANCNMKISWQYPLIEILFGAMAVIYFPVRLNLHELLNYMTSVFILYIFVCHFLIDIRHHILPDSLNLALLILFAFKALYFEGLSWTYSGLGLAVGFLFPLGIAWIFYLVRKVEGLGGGDIKLYAALGVMMGPFGILEHIFLSCFLGSIVGLTLMALGKAGRDTEIPFGPSILVIAFLQLYTPFIGQLKKLVFI
ncbi:MAG: prepilin peptidase [Halobacteriovoraceae bacterium]|nr:prepilin peptidase [Halobacteriovoraceae bacterium]